MDTTQDPTDLAPDLIEAQMALESEGITMASARIGRAHDDARDMGRMSMSPAVQRLLKGSVGRFAEVVRELMGRRGPRKISQLSEVTKGITADQVALIVSRVILDQLTRDVTYTGLAAAIGKALNDEQNLIEFQKADPGYYKRVIDRVNRAAPREGKVKHLKDAFCVSLSREFSTVHQRKVRTTVGILLLDAWVATTKLVEVQVVRQGRKTTKWVKANDKTLEFIRKYNEDYGYYRPVTLPMVIPPKDWDNLYQGGYYTLSLPLIKSKFQSEKQVEAVAQGDLSRVFQSINTLQSVPWRINQRVLEFARAVVDTPLGESVFPYQRDPGKPEWTPEDGLGDDLESRKIRLENRRELALWHKARARGRSKELQVRACLDLGHRFRTFPRLYFPHQVDFRGRIYSSPLWLSPQGPDYSRGLLEFAEGVELGTVGAYWLYVHAANTFGYDKVSLDERVQWVVDHLDDILATAQDPWDNRWWLTGDPKKHLQFLAACFEIQGYHEVGPTYKSRIPVAVDGSCNGLQHLSAMLLDEVGGQHTNLVPSDKPADIYAEVARQALGILRDWASAYETPEAARAAYDAQDEEYRAKWAGKRPKDGDQRTQWADDRSAWWKTAAAHWGNLWVSWGHLNRSAVKRCVMITPYGGTQQAMMEYLREYYNEVDQVLAPEAETKGLIVLTKAVVTAIGRVVVASKDAMEWLQKCAGVFDGPVAWTVPSGFVCFQDYRNVRSEIVATRVSGKIRKYTFGVETEDPDKAKAKQGIAPNVIHSLDASALVDTVALGTQEGITAWSMIHDSYATHAARMPVLNHCLRKAFVETYSRKCVLSDLRDQWVSQCPQGEFPEVPQKGALDLRRVMRSKYFFA